MKKVKISGKAVGAYKMYVELKEKKNLQELNKWFDEAKRLLRECLGDFEVGKSLVTEDGEKVIAVWNMGSKARLVFDEAKFADEHKDLYKKYCTKETKETHVLKFQI